MIGIVVFLVAIQATFYIALQFPAIQTFIIKKVVNSLEDNIDGKINIDKIYIIFFNKIILKNISIVSTNPSGHLDSLKKNFHQSDTLVSCKKISIGISPKELLKLEIKLNSVNLQDGVFNLQNEGNSTTNLSRIFKLDGAKTQDTTQKKTLNLLAKSLKISNFRFTLNNPDKYTNNGDSTINFTDLSLSNINVNINQIKLERDTLFATVKNISATDKSGFTLNTLNCNLAVSGTEARFNNLFLVDNYSRIEAGYFSMKYKSSKDFSEFTDKVVLGIDFKDTYLNFKTIGRFAPTLQNSSLAFFISGEAVGTVSNIKSGSLKVTSESGLTFVDIKANLTGLPDIRETTIIAEIAHCYTTSNDIGQIVSSINNTPPAPVFKQLAPLVQYSFTGDFVGLLTDFVADGEITSSIGKINIDVLFKTGSKQQGILFKGAVKTYNFNVGRLISNKLLGELSMSSTFSAMIRGEKEGGSNISIDSLRINKLGLNGYNYSNLYAVGKYTDKDFDGRIICHDPNLDFIFQGLFSFTKKEDSKYNFYIDIPYANLAAINIDKRDSISDVSVRATANFIQSPDKNIIGNIDIKNSGYINSKGSFNLGSIKLTSHQTDSSFSTVLTAPFAKATFNGTAPISNFIKKILAITLYSKYNNYFDKETDTPQIISQRDNYSFTAQTFDTRGICEFLLPGFYIQDSTKIDVTIDRDNQLKSTIKSGRLAIGTNYIKDIDVLLKNNSSAINLNLSSKEMKVAGFNMDHLFVNMKGSDNMLDVSLGFKDTLLNNTAKINTMVEFIKDTVKFTTPVYRKNVLVKEIVQKEVNKSIEIHINDSELGLKGRIWKFEPSTITIADSVYSFNHIKLFSGEQNLILDGFMSKSKKDSISVSLNKFNIEVFNVFMKKPFDFEGYLSGKGDFSTLDGTPKLFLDITGDSMYVAHTSVGKLKLMSKWNPADQRFNIFVNTRLQDKTNLNVLGYYQPDSSYVDINASLSDLKVNYFEPFLSDIISKTSGTVSGDFRLHGPVKNLNLDGSDCRLNNFNFTVNFTQVPYTLNGAVQVNNTGIHLKDIPITDQFGSVGIVNGGLSYQYFKNIALDLKVDFENFQGLSTKERDNEAFYGNAFATGSLLVKGPLDKILLDANISSDAKTYIHIPLSNAATANQTNLLTFKAPQSSIDTYEEVLKQDVLPKQPTELDIKLRTSVNPQAEIDIEINKSLGDVIKATGSGIISMDINPNKEVFDIFGTYTISQGSYKFVLLGFLAAKDFMIQPGGIINFNGNITNTTLNLTAIYRTKASINTLIADTSSVSNRRTVDCEIGMSGQLMNPELTFNISIPDLDPTTKVRVESALNTAGKIQKQFMALLVSGGFIPDEQSGIANNSTILYSNASEILSNQLNNVFQQLGIPLDLGLNYQPGSKGTNIFDVAVSTQLFNNRVLINGNIGNDPYANTNNRDVIGNLDIEIKLDKNGRLRLDIFSHAADKYSNYLDDKQRSGLGIGYQQEFNNVKEIFRKKTAAQKEYEKEKKQREKAKKAREKATRKEATTSKTELSD